MKTGCSSSVDKRFSVNFTRAVLKEHGFVVLCPIALVLVKAVLRVAFRIVSHHAVAINFGDDRRAGDDKDAAIALDDSALGQIKAGYLMRTINQNNPPDPPYLKGGGIKFLPP